MKTPALSKLKFTCLLAPGSNQVILERESQDIERVLYAMHPEVGNAWIDSLVFHDGIVLCRAVHDMEPSPRGQLIPILDVEDVSTEPTFNVQIWVSGMGYHHDLWQGRNIPEVELVAFPGRDTFRLQNEWHTKVLVEGGAISEMRSVTVPLSVMKTLLGREALEILLRRLGLSAECQAAVVPIPLHVSTPLREAMSGPFTGAARKLFAQARVLDYLAQLFNFVVSNELAPTRLAPDSKIEELHQYLVSLEGQMPTLIELAKEFGISARRLNTDFRAKYGLSIYSFITEHRLSQAHAILLTEPVAMKLLAARFGYSHVNHFSAAFKRRFGYPPGSLKRKGS